MSGVHSLQVSKAGPSSTGRRRVTRPRSAPPGSTHAAQTWAMIASFLFGALRLNALLLVGALPLALLCVLAANPLSAVPALILGLYLAMPIITAGFCAFRDAPVFQSGDRRDGRAEDGRPNWWDGFEDQQLLRPVLRVIRRTAPTVLRTTALPMGIVLVLFVDAQWVLAQGWGLMVAPALLIAALLGLMTALGVCALVSEGADAPATVLARTAAHAMLRYFPFTLLSVLVLGVGLLGLIWQPVLCWALASSLILYVVWANTRWSIKPALRSA